MFFNPKVLGKHPSDERLARIRRSPNFRDGAFQNQRPTPMMANGSFLSTLWKFINKPKTTKPDHALPAIKTDLRQLPEGSMVWFGHSSYLLKIAGRHLLVDPVFSGYAAPMHLSSAKSFEGSNGYTVADLPDIDILIISHDHYDHCDYDTLLQLQPRVRKVVTSLGVGAHLEYWGFAPGQITELDWGERTESDGITIIAAPARHFSGRSFQRGRTLWSSFILQAAGLSLYLGADSGYDVHFKEIGDAYGPFDLAILECGQYNERWPYIHMMPEETVQASIDLRAKCLFPVHWGKFSLSLHPWDEPIERIRKKASELQVPLTTPRIGEPVIIGREYPHEAWWQ